MEHRLVVSKGEGVERRMDWEFGITRCKLFYVRWINHKVLLQSTESYIQDPLINHHGKEYIKKKNIYIMHT